jgi:hypothetical protein
MVEIGGPEQPKCPTNRSVVKGEEKAILHVCTFYIYGYATFHCESRVEDHKQLSTTSRRVGLLERESTCTTNPLAIVYRLDAI